MTLDEKYAKRASAAKEAKEFSFLGAALFLLLFLNFIVFFQVSYPLLAISILLFGVVLVLRNIQYSLEVKAIKLQG